ncbi:MAG: lycopene cyclase domain-containing protein [Puniceicoccaceae bacterium]
MTYWGYHLIFTLPLLAFLTWLWWARIRLVHWVCFGVVAVIVMAFTTPWDNYAVYLGVWGFGDGVSLGYPWASMREKTPLIGHIPFEEYAYFLIEAALATLVAIRLLPDQQKVGKKGVEAG